MRSFTYGLYAVSACHGGERGIFTANWLSQASFDPPMVMISVERDSSTLPLTLHSKLFTVSPFTSGSKALAGDLGRPRKRAGDKFETFDLQAIETSAGGLVLADSVGYVVCALQHEADAGDSFVLIGEVVEAQVLSGGEPLTMSEAKFRHFG